MAATVLAPTSIAKSDIGKSLTMTAVITPSNNDTIALGAYPDQRVFIVIANSDASHDATVVFSAGDGLLSSLGSISVTVPATKTVFVPLVNLETARILNTLGGGANLGKIIVNTTIASGGTIGDVTFGIAELA
jgi:hypothetical protein